MCAVFDIFHTFNIEPHAGCRFMSADDDPIELLHHMHISQKDWDTPSYQAVLNAVTQFPMQLFCTALFSHRTNCDELLFIPSFFLLLIQSVCVFPCGLVWANSYIYRWKIL